MGSERTKTEINQGFDWIGGLLLSICRGAVEEICTAISLHVNCLKYLGLQAVCRKINHKEATKLIKYYKDKCTTA